MSKKYTRLLQSIHSTIYEGIVKLGYEKNTSISIYYDLGLLNYLLDTSFNDVNSCMDYLKPFLSEQNNKGNLLLITLVKERFQFTVTAVGIEEILSDYQTKPFLKELVELARTHHFSLEDVKQLFHKYDKQYHFENVDNEEFQYIFSFQNSDFDEYIYCFNLEDCYYHRLLPYDYERL